MAILKERFPIEYDELRDELKSLIEEKFQTENPDVYESGFIAFFTDALATASLDSLFYSSMTYKEAFLSQAVLPESVLNIAQQLSYNVPNAIPSEVDILISVPFAKNGVRLWDYIQFTFPKWTRFSASSLPFLLPYDVIFNFNYDPDAFVNNLYKQTDTAISKIPFEFSTVEPDPVGRPGETDTYLQFLVTGEQYNIEEYTFTAPRPEPLRFNTIEVGFSDQVYKTEVYIRPPNDGAEYELWTEVDNVFQLNYGEKGYATSVFQDKVVFTFGNGIYGRIPLTESSILIKVFETKGKEGKVVAGTVTTAPRIYNDAPTGGIVTMYVSNPRVSTDGQNRETIEQTRRNARDYARAVNGLVSERNYENLGAVLQIPLQDSMAIIKRSDIHSNEIFTYIATKFSDTELVPSRSDVVTFDNLVLQPITKDGYTFRCPFEIYPNIASNSLDYRYVAKSLTGNVDLIATTEEAKNHAAVLTGYVATYDSVARTFTLKIPYNYVKLDSEGNDDPTYPPKLRLYGQMGLHSYVFNNDTGNRLFDVIIDRDDVEDGLTTITVDFKYYDDSVPTEKLLRTYKMNFVLVQNLDSLIASPTKDLGGNIIEAYDVPLIEESFYLSNLQWLDINMLQQMAMFADVVVRYRIMTDQVYLKFANTIGKVHNIEYNDTNPNAVKTYVSPNFPLPIEISMRVYIKEQNNAQADVVIREVKEAIYEYFKPKFGFEVNIYKSEITKVAQNVDNVEFVELIEPYDSIVYDYYRKDLTKQQLIEFTPEFTWFNESNIQIEIIVD